MTHQCLVKLKRNLEVWLLVWDITFFFMIDLPYLQVIVKVLTKLQWNYIAVVYDAGTFGSSSYKVLHEKLVSAGICLTMAIRVNADDDQSAEDTINKLLSTKVTGVIYVGPVTYTTSLINHGNKMLPGKENLIISNEHCLLSFNLFHFICP